MMAIYPHLEIPETSQVADGAVLIAHSHVPHAHKHLPWERRGPRLTPAEKTSCLSWHWRAVAECGHIEEETAVSLGPASS